MKHPLNYISGFVMQFLILSVGEASAQTISCGPIDCEGEETTIDARDFIGCEPFLLYNGHDDRPTRSEGQGQRWIERIKNMPDYLLDFYQEGNHGDRFLILPAINEDLYPLII